MEWKNGWFTEKTSFETISFAPLNKGMEVEVSYNNEEGGCCNFNIGVSELEQLLAKCAEIRNSSKE